MAAYAATVTLDLPKTKRIPGSGLGFMTGTVDVTNYNSTLAAITDITNRFKGSVTVLLNSISDNGYWGHWVDASSSVKCFIGDYSNASDGPALEAPDDTDIGAFHFVAFGVLK